ncbi:MAG: hypothetical protein C4520_18780 [Candidatus Abyssobacteria bacterium SURF_5]|uniref:DUF5667 domain-containing protein n=1 Tax=Abyssobacteria bacterium (strain SURF_5) TaxID=2093360 RepID=A0A3A4N9E4_ABYX5|nr:MAG: hypothetical protein C4520_18780 [Candidatus Abyssubacteria bacterium SURF_5]
MQWLIPIFVWVCAASNAPAEQAAAATKVYEAAGEENCERAERIIEKIPDETEYFFHLASTSYVENDLQTSAKQVRQAADSLKKHLTVCADELRPAILASMQGMEALADSVEKGRVSSPRVLHEVFARAELVLAKHHVKRAQQAWDEKNHADAGQALGASTTNIENAVLRTAYKDTGTISKAVEQGKLLSGKLLDGGDIEPIEVTKTFADIGTAIGTFEQSFQVSAK